MAWTKRFLDYVPGTPEGVGAWAMSLAIIGACVAVMLANLPLAIATAALSVAGVVGPNLYNIKQQAILSKKDLSILAESQEDKTVDAFIQCTEIFGRFQTMIENEDRSREGRIN